MPTRSPVATPVDSGRVERVERAEPGGHADRDELTPRSLMSLQRAAGNQAAVAAVSGGSPVAQRKAAGDPGAWPNAMLGSSGEHVGVLQQKLNATRSATPPLIVDARFGSLTAAAARVFQQGNGLTADSIVGKKTGPRSTSRRRAAGSIPRRSRSARSPVRTGPIPWPSPTPGRRSTRRSPPGLRRPPARP